MDDKVADRAEVFEGEGGLWYVRTKSNNGQTIMTSEGYQTVSHALKVALDTGLPYKTIRKEDGND